MKRLAWLTDIHLNFLSPLEVEAFLDRLAATPADAFVIGGDIGEADDVTAHLHAIAERVSRPVHLLDTAAAAHVATSQCPVGGVGWATVRSDIAL